MWNGVGVAIFRVIVAVETGGSLCPLFVNAASRSAAIDLARSHGLIMNGEKANATQITGNLISLDFGSIAIGDCPLAHKPRRTRQLLSDTR
jgi:hypothetical protein